MKNSILRLKDSAFRTSPRVTVFYYVLASFLWFLLLDLLLVRAVTDPVTYLFLQTLKGLVFVLGTALLLYRIVSRYATLLQRSIQALETSEQEFRATFEQARVGLARISLDGRYLKVNDCLCQMLGYSREELLAFHFRDVTHPEDRSFGFASMGPLLAGEAKTLSWEKRYLHKDGHEVRGHVTLSLARSPSGDPSHFVGVVEDLTETRRTERTLHESQELLRHILASISDHIYVTRRSPSGEWTELYASPHAEAITGYAIEEFQGNWSFWDSIIHPDDFPRAAAQLERLASGHSSETEYRIRRADGRAIWLRDSVRVEHHKDGSLTTYGVLSDITARKQTESELRANDRLLQTVATATHHLLTANDFAEGMARVLRTLGEGVRVDRVYLFRHHPHPVSGEPALSQRYEWARETVAPQIDNPLLQNQEYESLGFRRWLELLQASQPISGLVRDFPASEYAILSAQGILSLLVVPIIVDEELQGFIGFDDCNAERYWSRNEVSILMMVAATIGGALKREQAHRALQRSEARNRAILQATPDMMFRLNRDGFYLDYMADDRNSLYLVPPGMDIVGHHIREFLPPEVVEERMYAIHRALSTGEMQVVKFSIPRPTGSRYYESRIVVSGPDEVLTIVRDVTEQRQAEATIQYQAYHDPLTGLPNRLLFQDRLAQALPQARRRGLMVAVLYMDLDRFKLINDTLGHNAGDMLLQAVAQRLSTCLREGDTIARLGGDEFGVVLLDLEDPQTSTKIAQKILNALTPAFSIAGQELFVTPSIGVSIYPTDGDGVDMLTKNAETAMYRAKEQGRNTCQLYAPAMNATASRRLALENALRRALDRGEFALYYQPQVRSSTGEIVGMEALLRWNHPELGFLAPGQWISLAEETGLIVPIGEWVLRAACEQNRAWHEAGYKELRMAVNLSARQFQQPDISQCVTEIVLQAGLQPRYLDLEITENTIMRDLDQTVNHLRDLKALGVRLAIDDFGTGYSSLNYLKRFEVDTLKIDRSFVRDLHGDANDAAIVQAIVAMAHSLKLQVLAEGVETLPQRAFLQSLHCDEMQGYLFSKPLPAEQATLLLTSGVPYLMLGGAEAQNGHITLP